MIMISRKDLLKELLPGFNALFDLEYSKFGAEIFNKEDYIVEVDFDEDKNKCSTNELS